MEARLILAERRARNNVQEWARLALMIDFAVCQGRLNPVVQSYRRRQAVDRRERSFDGPKFVQRFH